MVANEILAVDLTVCGFGMPTAVLVSRHDVQILGDVEGGIGRHLFSDTVSPG